MILLAILPIPILSRYKKKRPYIKRGVITIRVEHKRPFRISFMNEGLRKRFCFCLRLPMKKQMKIEKVMQHINIIRAGRACNVGLRIGNYFY